MSESVPLCAWCETPAVTEVVVVPGRKKKKTAPVCEEHAQQFERRGQMTTRLEVDQKMERERKRSQWKARQRWH